MFVFYKQLETSYINYSDKKITKNCDLDYYFNQFDNGSELPEITKIKINDSTGVENQKEAMFQNYNKMSTNTILTATNSNSNQMKLQMSFKRFEKIYYDEYISLKDIRKERPFIQASIV